MHLVLKMAIITVLCDTFWSLRAHDILLSNVAIQNTENIVWLIFCILILHPKNVTDSKSLFFLYKTNTGNIVFPITRIAYCVPTYYKWMSIERFYSHYCRHYFSIQSDVIIELSVIWDAIRLIWHVKWCLPGGNSSINKNINKKQTLDNGNG